MDERPRPAHRKRPAVPPPPPPSHPCPSPLSVRLEQPAHQPNYDSGSVPTEPGDHATGLSGSVSVTESTDLLQMNAALLPAGGSWDDYWDDDDDESFEVCNTSAFALDEKAITDTKQMSSLEARLASFSNWPRDSPQPPMSLAKYGFFYTGKDDRVQCHSCGVVLWSWAPYRADPKAPVKAHRKFHPDCSFLKSRAWANAVATLNPTGLLLNWAKADAPHMISDEARRDTFKLMPMYDSILAVQASTAGWYLLADGKRVSCFYCGVTAGITSIQDPWLTHGQASPSCTFLKRKRGPIFVRKIKRELSRDAEAESATSTGENNASGLHIPKGVVKSALGKLQGLSGVIQKKQESLARVTRQAMGRGASFDMENSNEVPGSNADIQFQTETDQRGPSTPPFRLKPPVVARPSSRESGSSLASLVMSVMSDNKTKCETKALGEDVHDFRSTVIQMGFTEEQIQTAMKERINRGTNGPVTAGELVQLILDLSTASVKGEETSVTGASGPDSSVQDRLCIVCMECVSDHVFVPCGHLKTCGKCSDKMENCPLCRKVIHSKVKVFF